MVVDSETDAHPRAVVMDFGLARALRDVTDPALLGTPSYMAPEQLTGSAVGRRHNGAREAPEGSHVDGLAGIAAAEKNFEEMGTTIDSLVHEGALVRL